MGRVDNLYQILWIWNTNSITKLHATAASTWRESVSRSAKGTTGLQRTLMSRWETRITCQKYSSYKNQIMNYCYYYYYCYYYTIIINTTLRKTEVSALQYTQELACISFFHKTIFTYKVFLTRRSKRSEKLYLDFFLSKWRLLGKVKAAFHVNHISIGTGNVKDESNAS